MTRELYGLAIAYNLVRFEAERVAKQARVPPVRISFVAALTFIENALGTDNLGRAPQRLINLLEGLGHYVLPERKPRSYRREVKIKMSNDPRKRPVQSSSSKRVE